MTNTSSLHAAQPGGMGFSGYQKFVVAVLAFLQFTIVLDFMLLAPLGAIVMPALNITPGNLAMVVSAYAFAAGVSGHSCGGICRSLRSEKNAVVFLQRAS